MFAIENALHANPLIELHAALDGCAAESVHELPDAALAEDLVELRRAADRVEAGALGGLRGPAPGGGPEFARRLALFDHRKACRTEGALSTTA